MVTPFDQAWAVLKMTVEESRQTELGEYHPDFPSSYGPVDYYHGTTVGPASRINFEGLKPATPWYGVNGTNPKGIYAAGDLEEASDYASMRGQDRNQAGRVFGIRGGVPETPINIVDDHIGRVVRFNESIPRQYIAPVPIPLNQKTV